VIRVDARASFVRGRLVAQRRAPKVPVGDSPDPNSFDRVRGLDASLWWDSVTNRSRQSRKCPRVARECSDLENENLNLLEACSIVGDALASRIALASKRGQCQT
jgi:hypothetical protein